MFPSDYEEFIHKSRYARWLDTENRRESWPETVGRYFDFMLDRHPTMSNLIEALKDQVMRFDVMTSMRALMTAGPALARDNTAGFNPVSGDTLVLTERGMQPINSLAGTSNKVVNLNGEWTDAEFRSYGEQETFEVVLGYGKASRTVKATGNHRWVKTSGEVVSTGTLQVGDTIPYASAPRPEEDSDYGLGVRHGVVYGDGTAVKALKRVKGYMVRLCGDKKELLPWFEGLKFSCPESCNGDPIVYVYDNHAATTDLKSLPAEGETPSYILGFIRGLLAVDGYVCKTNAQVQISGPQSMIDWFNQVAPTVGIWPQGSTELPSETNFGDRNFPTYTMRLDRASLSEKDFLSSKHQRAWKPMKREFRVKDILPAGVTEVFCAEVPDTNTFVLDGGIVTGNCAFTVLDHPRSFDEAMYILLCGTGIGFSVEREFTSQLPSIPSLTPVDDVIFVGDSKEGWAHSFRELLEYLFNGQIPGWNTDAVRKAGARLKTFGGRASGPAPLIELFEFTVALFLQAQGRQLKPIECHDLMCKVGEIVVVGGVRRSAMISLSDLFDQEMAQAKSGAWWVDHPHRGLANNSAVYVETPSVEIFSAEWQSLIDSQSGERGIFSRQASIEKAKENGRREYVGIPFGTNPCSEIILRPCQFCNLTEVVIRAEDTLSVLKDKVTTATILGTFQATLTDFPYLRPIWQKNTEEERLLGVSLTGIMDNPVTNGSMGEGLLVEWLESMRRTAVVTNQVWAESFGIKPSAAITCVKPSGTVSQLVNAASGIHARHSRFYVRTVRGDIKDPMTVFLTEHGIPVEPCAHYPETTAILSFPIKAPEGCVTRHDMTALEQMHLWMLYAKHWCEHKPSVTISVRDEEWAEVGEYVLANFEHISGVSFLPYDGGTYVQAPYQEITEAEYETLLAQMPAKIDWSDLAAYEFEDNTMGSQTLACSAGVCELVDV